MKRLQWSEDLCAGCGACAAVCPNKGIRMRFDSKRSFFVPVFDSGKCRECGNCLMVCPLQGINVSEKNLGDSVGFFRGHATDKDLRRDSSSGGIVSAVSIFLLEKKLVEGVLTARMNPLKPLEAEFFLAVSAKEAKDAKGSKYSPASFSPELEKALVKGKRIAFVGLPCQVKGVKLLMERNPKAKKLIAFTVGIFCSHLTGRAGTAFFLEREGIPLDRVKRIEYRGSGWPGGMTVKAGKERRFFPLGHYMDNFFGPYFFGVKGCLMCYDQTSEFADLSVGDGYFGDKRVEGLGESAVIARTRKGLELLERAQGEGRIELEKTSAEEIEFVQRRALSFKKKNIWTRIRIQKSRGKAVPLVSGEPAGGSLKHYLGFLLLNLNMELSRREWFRKLFKRIPMPLVKAYKVFVFYIAFK